MMFDSLYRFLVKYNYVTLPGIGTISISVTPASSEFVERSFYSPLFSFSFEESKEQSSKKIYSWLASLFDISERDAVVKLNDFVYELKKQLDAGLDVSWPGVGVFKKASSTGIRFLPTSKEYLKDHVVAEKVIRENAEHTVRVGEQERTSRQMSEMLQLPSEKRKRKWWLWPAIIFLLMLILLAWYFYTHGIMIGSAL